MAFIGTEYWKKTSNEVILYEVIAIYCIYTFYLTFQCFQIVSASSYKKRATIWAYFNEISLFNNCRSSKILQKSTIRQLISYFCTFWQKYSIEYMESYCESVSGSGIKTKYADLLVEFRHNGRGFLLSLSLITPYSIHHYWI